VKRTGTQRARPRTSVPAGPGAGAAAGSLAARGVFSIGGSSGSLEQAASSAARSAVTHPAGPPRMATGPALRGRRRGTFDMWMFFLEAFCAMMALILIIWWTMFHGRKKGERIDR
jgi:hypothetical protein